MRGQHSQAGEQRQRERGQQIANRTNEDALRVGTTYTLLSREKGKRSQQAVNELNMGGQHSLTGKQRQRGREVSR